MLKQKSFKTRRISSRITEETAEKLVIMADMECRSLTNMLEMLISEAWKKKVPVAGMKGAKSEQA